MTSKAKEAKEPDSVDVTAPILYDAEVSQTIPFTLNKTVVRNGKRVLQKARLTHTLGPLSNERYFEYEAEMERLTAKFKGKVTNALWEPKLRLWNQLVESATGYPENFDWKSVIHQSDSVRTLGAFLEIEILDPDMIEFDVETETIEDDATFSNDEAAAIPFRTMFAGALILNMSHSFRQESKAELDEFFAIEGNDPMPNALASGQKLTTAEKLYNLGRRLLKDTEGYAVGSDIPAWHLAGTTRSFFLRQLARMGKF